MHLALTMWSDMIKKLIVKSQQRQLAIILSNQCRIGSITIQDPIFITDEGHTARCELDTHADTCVAGANFLMQSFEGQTCDVMPYSDTYEAVRDMPVVTAATAWTCTETGKTIILYFPQVLWYGKKMKTSLINPNQLRHYGLRICDDITDKSRPFGIELDDNINIPFMMEGTVIYFNTRVPTEWEMENCRIQMMTDDTPWDPSRVEISAVGLINQESTSMADIRHLSGVMAAVKQNDL
jgi:hypothetical protein